MSLANGQLARIAAAPRRKRFGPLGWLEACARRCPFVALFLVMIVSNVFGSLFNFSYNQSLIVDRHMSQEQQRVFWEVAAPWYNLIAYTACVGAMVLLLWPLMRCRNQLRRGSLSSPRPGTRGRGAGGEGANAGVNSTTAPQVDPEFLAYCRRRVVALPVWQMVVNSAGWLPGAIFFPWVVTALGGPHRAADIWLHFAISTFVSTLLTTAQTFFLLEWYLILYLYDDFFQDARPAEVDGVMQIPLRWRLLMFWGAVVVVPMLALLAVALNFPEHPQHQEELLRLFCGVAVVGLASGSLIFYLVGRDLRVWLHWQGVGAGEIARGNLDFRIAQKRPDQFGKLTDAFNDMASALTRARQERETFGQLVDPEIRDEILANDPGLGGVVQEITVLFADLRGFTRRSAGEPPDQIVALLNRFFSLSVEAIKPEGGHINKFLGDGFMALFGWARHGAEDHADQALRAAQGILIRLVTLNQELDRQRHAPLQVGIGIHTGPALVGCVGAMLPSSDGVPRMRREFTAIGETVNLCQRIEQLTKVCGGPILLSHASRQRLKETWELSAQGAHLVTGCDAPIVVYTLQEGRNVARQSEPDA